MKCDTVAAWQTRWIPKSQRTVWRAPWQPGDWVRFFCPVSPVLDNPDSKHFQHQNTSSNWCRGHRMSHTTLWLTASNAQFFVRPFSGSGSQTWASWHLAVKSHWSLLFITVSPAVILCVLWKCSLYYCHGFYRVRCKWACAPRRCLEHFALWIKLSLRDWQRSRSLLWQLFVLVVSFWNTKRWWTTKASDSETNLWGWALWFIGYWASVVVTPCDQSLTTFTGI